MAAIDDVWLAALTKDGDDAGSRNRFNLTVNIDGAHVFGHDFLLCHGDLVPPARMHVENEQTLPHRQMSALRKIDGLQRVGSGLGGGYRHGRGGHGKARRRHPTSSRKALCRKGPDCDTGTQLVSG